MLTLSSFRKKLHELRGAAESFHAELLASLETGNTNWTTHNDLRQKMRILYGELEHHLIPFSNGPEASPVSMPVPEYQTAYQTALIGQPSLTQTLAATAKVIQHLDCISGRVKNMTQSEFDTALNGVRQAAPIAGKIAKKPAEATWVRYTSPIWLLWQVAKALQTLFEAAFSLPRMLFAGLGRLVSSFFKLIDLKGLVTNLTARVIAGLVLAVAIYFGFTQLPPKASNAKSDAIGAPPQDATKANEQYGAPQTP